MFANASSIYVTWGLGEVGSYRRIEEMRSVEGGDSLRSVLQDGDGRMRPVVYSWEKLQTSDHGL